MTNEEMERAMQFIITQQAQFAANQQQLDERVTRLETHVTTIAQALAVATQQIADNARQIADNAQRIADLTRQQAHMNEVVAAMYDTHRQTEEKLDAFIGVLERYISEGRNGGANNKDAT
jgi:methyl-accepting chemotaxis protein